MGFVKEIGGTAYFGGNDGVNGFELWKSDGTDGRHRDGGQPGSGHESLVPPTFITNVNGTLFFNANDGVSGYELWKSDGTAAGTVFVKGLTPAEVQSPVS